MVPTGRTISLAMAKACATTCAMAGALAGAMVGAMAGAVALAACTPAFTDPAAQQAAAGSPGDEAPVRGESSSPLLNTFSDALHPRATFSDVDESGAPLTGSSASSAASFECQILTDDTESPWFACTSPLDLSGTIAGAGDFSDVVAGRVRVRKVDAAGGAGGAGDFSEKAFRRGPVPRGVSGAVYAVEPAREGGYYVGGAFRNAFPEFAPGLVKLSANGDLRFNLATRTGVVGGDVMTLVPLPLAAGAPEGSESFYAGGSFTEFEGTLTTGLVRVRSDASRDPSFGTGAGFAVLSGAMYVKAVAVDESARVYAAGRFNSYRGVSANRIVRLDATGARDATFAVGTGFNNTALSLARVPAVATGAAATVAGKLYVGGAFTTYNGQSAPRVARLNADGSLDTSFAVGAGFDGAVQALALVRDAMGAPTGEVFVAGSFTRYQGAAAPGLARLRTDGSMDSAFRAGAGFDGAINALLALPGEKLAVGGAFANYDGLAQRGLALLTGTGGTDDSFTAAQGVGGSVSALSASRDGETILVSGDFTSYRGRAARGLVRVRLNGDVDGNFNARRGLSAAPQALLTVGSELWVGGGFKYYQGDAAAGAVKLVGDGSREFSFDAGEGFDGSVLALREAPSANGGGVYVGGSFSNYNGASSPRLARLTSTGRLDRAFAMGAGFDDSVQALALAGEGTGSGSDAQLYAAGKFTHYQGAAAAQLVRLNADGGVDTAFSTGAGFGSSDGLSPPVIYALRVGAAGKLYVGGRFDTYRGVAAPGLLRLNADGSRDTTFDAGAGFTHSFYGSGGSAGDGAAYVSAIELTGDGGVWAGGFFTHFAGAASAGLVRINAAGMRDATFAVGSGFDRDGSHDAYVWTLRTETRGGQTYLWAGGSFDRYDGAAVGGLVRLAVSGVRDTRVGELDGNVYAIAVDRLGAVFAGAFAYVHDALRLNLARWSASDVLDESFHGQER